MIFNFNDFGDDKGDKTSYKEFEKKHKTKVKMTKDKKLKWEIDGNTKVISREALGRYKRYRVNMNEVLELVSFNKTVNGSVGSAKKVIKYLERKGK